MLDSTLRTRQGYDFLGKYADYYDYYCLYIYLYKYEVLYENRK